MPRYELTLEVRGRVRVEVEAPDMDQAQAAVIRERKAAELLGGPGLVQAEVYVGHVRTLDEQPANGGRP